MQNLVFVLAVILLLLFPHSNAYRVDRNPYRQREVLADGKYVLEWQVNLQDSRVTFNVTAQTRGFVGLGFNRRGVMDGADVVVGGVLRNGRTYFSDRHIVGRQLIPDRSQDYTLHEARETRTHTFLSFSRAFDTCDGENDLEFEVGGDILSVIYAFGEDDRVSYHHGNRGSFPVYLLDPDMVPTEIRGSPPFGNYIDGNLASMGNWKVWSVGKSRPVPAADTAYICTFHKAPNHDSKKLHIVGFRTMLESEVEERHIHHFILTRCRPPAGYKSDEVFGPWLRNPGEACYIRSQPAQQSNIPNIYCQEFVHVWAKGGQPHFWPEHVGFPMNEESDQYYMLQVHYDNRAQVDVEGLQARFALEVFYTENLRKYEGGTMIAGVAEPGAPTIMVPPDSPQWEISGLCGSSCTDHFLPPNGVKIFAVLQHTHIAGRGIGTLHLRNKRQLPMILHDDNYDFNIQHVRTLNEERTLLPGDSIMTRCIYDTTDGRNGSVTIGGFRTRHEMCAISFHYYPYMRRSDNEIYSVCGSELKSEAYLNFLGVRNWTWSDKEIEFIITSPERNAGLLMSEVGNNIHWTPARRGGLQQLQKVLSPVTLCPNQVGDFQLYAFQTSGENNVAPYEAPDTCRTKRGGDDDF